MLWDTTTDVALELSSSRGRRAETIPELFSSSTWQKPRVPEFRSLALIQDSVIPCTCTIRHGIRQ